MSKSSQIKPPARARKRNTVIITIVSAGIGALVIIASVILLISWANQSGLIQNEKTAMSTYLEKKYNQAFVITDLKSSASGLGGTRTYTAAGHSVQEPDIAFTISRQDGSSSYNEEFLSALWSKEAKIPVDNFLKSQLISMDKYEVGASPTISYRQSITGFTPSFTEVQVSNPNDYGYSLTAYKTGVQSSEKIPKQYLEEAYKILEFVRSQGALVHHFTYYYRSDAYAATKEGSQPNYEYQISIESPSLEQLQYSDELVQYIEPKN